MPWLAERRLPVGPGPVGGYSKSRGWCKLASSSPLRIRNRSIAPSRSGIRDPSPIIWSTPDGAPKLTVYTWLPDLTIQHVAKCAIGIGLPIGTSWLPELIEYAATVLEFALTMMIVRGPEKTKLNGPPVPLAELNGVTTPVPSAPLPLTGKTTTRPDGRAISLPLAILASPPFMLTTSNAPSGVNEI